MRLTKAPESASSSIKSGGVQLQIPEGATKFNFQADMRYHNLVPVVLQGGHSNQFGDFVLGVFYYTGETVDNEVYPPEFLYTYFDIKKKTVSYDGRDEIVEGTVFNRELLSDLGERPDDNGERGWDDPIRLKPGVDKLILNIDKLTVPGAKYHRYAREIVGELEEPLDVPEPAPYESAVSSTKPAETTEPKAPPKSKKLTTEDMMLIADMDEEATTVLDNIWDSSRDFAKACQVLLKMGKVNNTSLAGKWVIAYWHMKEDAENE